MKCKYLPVCKTPIDVSFLTNMQKKEKRIVNLTVEITTLDQQMGMVFNIYLLTRVI